MKKTIIFAAIVTVFLAMGTFFLLAQNKNRISMNSRWKKVEQYEKKALPESALEEVTKILEQAQKENNSPEIIKATIYKMKFVLSKDPSQYPTLIQELEQQAAKTKSVIQKGLMHSMLAELYWDYFEQNKWEISQRTELKGFVPDDMNEWTKSIFAKKTVVHLHSALQNKKFLQQAPSADYATIIHRGGVGTEMFATLYDLLLLRQIEILKKISDYTIEVDEMNTIIVKDELIITFDKLIDFQKQKNNLSAQVYAELKKLDIQYSTRDNEYMEELNRLEKQFEGNEAVVEVLAQKAQYYLDNQNFANPTDNAKRKAYNIAVDGIKKYPDYKRINQLVNIKNIILTKTLEVENKEVVKPNDKLKLTIHSTNVENMDLTIYRVDATPTDYQRFSFNRQTEQMLFPTHQQVQKQTIAISRNKYFNSEKTEIEIPTQDYGIYEYVLQDAGAKDGKAVGRFTVSDFALLEQANNSEQATSLIVVDRVSGKPLKKVTAQLYERRWGGRRYEIEKAGNQISAENGFFSIKKQQDSYNNFTVLKKGKDQYFSSDISLSYYINNGNKKDNDPIRTALFTDRSLYRPGQTVYFKGIIYQQKKQTIVPNEETMVRLIDVNGQKIAEQTLKTNEFGSFAGEFVLPESGLNGVYRLKSEQGSVSLWVEEYKRPTFEVTINKPKDEVRFGNKMQLNGSVKAYAGYPMQNAIVAYHIIRRPHRFWWWTPIEQEKTVAKGSAISDKKGEFTVEFTPLKQKEQFGHSWLRDNSQYYTYTIVAEVTDQKGETQMAEQYVSVGDKSLFILATIPKQLNKNEPLNLDVITQTLNGETMPSDVQYQVIRLQADNRYYEEWNDTSVMKETEVVMGGTFNTKDSLKLNLKETQTGAYKIKFTTKDSWNNEVKYESNFILFDTKEKKLPIKMYKWIQTENTEPEVGTKTIINYGTSTHNTWVLYELRQGSKVIHREWVTFNDEIRKFEIPFLESYGAGITAVFTFVKDEQLFTNQITLSKKVKEKKRIPSVTVFRDKLQPGETAEWVIHIPKAADSKTDAELLIGMYDASLDAIRPHTWNFDPTYRQNFPYTQGWKMNGIDRERSHAAYPYKRKKNPDYQFDRLNWFGLNLDKQYLYEGAVMGMVTQRANSLNSATPRAAADNAIVNKMELLNTAAKEKKENAMSANVALSSEVRDASHTPTRTNFNETAFFYPQLHTDSNGNVKVKFTAPESLTRWNVKMLTHTPNLYFGMEQMQAITQKELMIEMNLPRFVRYNDRITLAATVINLTNKPLTTNVSLQITDPKTNRIISTESSGHKTVSLQPKESKAVMWELATPTDTDLVIVKAVADAGTFSDGEQNYLPILPDNVLITESMPITIRSNQTRTFSFDSFIKKMQQVNTKNFAVEFASNPTWYAVQALPTLSKPTSENAISYLTAYYANALAGHIAEVTPNIKTVYSQWKKGSGEALKSNLEKKNELKNMLLEETPWVTDADNETRQKREIALLFETNSQGYNATQYLDKLLQLQKPSGGFSWFEGMPENRYVTQEILLHLARLQKMTNTSNQKIHSATQKALYYLDLKIAEDFENLKRHNKKYHKEQVINNLQLFYLHVRSYYSDAPIAKGAKNAVAFYKAQSEKYWTDWTLYGKAMMATVAHRNGNDLVANDILNSLKETALQSDELGMYWGTNIGNFWWYNRPVKVQTAMIEAFHEVAKSGKELEELKIWLLKQKQTQIWDTPISTVDAIYALLNYGNDWLAASNEKAMLTIGGEVLQPQKTEIGTGYFKTTIPTTTLKPKMGKIEVESNNKSGIGWGAAYWQYYQNIDKVQAHGKEMRVSKKLFVQTIINGKKVIQPMEQVALKKGDKVITRLVLTTDRDLEYVALKDWRAACFEPVEQRSGIEWKDGVVYYRTVKDASTQYFFDYLPKGTYVFEYEMWANNSGKFSGGIASVQCYYAPEFVTHSSGGRIVIK